MPADSTEEHGLIAVAELLTKTKVIWRAEEVIDMAYLIGIDLCMRALGIEVLESYKDGKIVIHQNDAAKINQDILWAMYGRGDSGLADYRGMS